jgi:hypothetical protein
MDEEAICRGGVPVLTALTRPRQFFWRSLIGRFRCFWPAQWPVRQSFGTGNIWDRKGKLMPVRDATSRNHSCGVFNLLRKAMIGVLDHGGW